MIAAAGSGVRLGAGGPKAFVELAGRPLLAWSVGELAAADGLGEVLVVAPPGEVERALEVARGALPEGSDPERVSAVAGGETRAESVGLGLAALDAAGSGAELVAVHDAARPLVTAALAEELVAALRDHPEASAVVAAAPLTDTVKRAREPRSGGQEPSPGERVVAATESRDRLWAAQTPQVFRAQALRAALAADPALLAEATDEAMLVERAGGTVVLHPSSPGNLKVTTRLDLRLAEALLAARG